MKEVKQASVEAEHRKPLPETNWEDVQEPGAYVEEGSEALIDGGSPIIVKESRGASRLRQVSKDPFVTTLEARLSCAQHNIHPNF